MVSEHTKSPAHEVEQVKNEEPVVLSSPSDPSAVARELIEAKHTGANDDLLLRRYRGNWWCWDGTRWVEAEDKKIAADAYAFTEFAVCLKWNEQKQEHELVPWHPNRHKIADLLDALGAITHLGEGVQAPAWIGEHDGLPSAAELVSVANGLLHIHTRNLHEHNPRLFNTTSVPFPYEPGAKTPFRWLQFLDELWPDDEDAQRALSEFFGYVISGRTDLHKILLLIGPTRAGKGVIARVLKALVGDGNHCGPTLSSLETNFGLMPLIGKPLAIISDARLGGGAKTHQVVERLLSISGEDMLTCDRKYHDHWTGTLPTRFFIISNELPRFGDASGAIANRFVLLTLSRSWLGKENIRLTKELYEELPGILNWSLDGLERLERQGSFTVVRSSDDALIALQDATSPCSAFVRDECQIGPYDEQVGRLYKAWKVWCEEHGHQSGSQVSFGIHLSAAHPRVKKIRPMVGGVREYRYQGIRLRPNETCSGPVLGPPEATSGRSAPAQGGPRSNASSHLVDGPRDDLGATCSITDDEAVRMFNQQLGAQEVTDDEPW